jgi:predicted cupin superfamily sugar epimerase
MQDWVSRLGLLPHPEGGFYRETWRSALSLPASALPQAAERSAATAIYYLLPTGVQSAWHRVASDELWLFHAGDPLDVFSADEVPSSTPTRLGFDYTLQHLVEAGRWQSARVVDGPFGYALVSCVVVPGFDFQDFEMLPTR